MISNVMYSKQGLAPDIIFLGKFDFYILIQIAINISPENPSKTENFSLKTQLLVSPPPIYLLNRTEFK